MGGTGTKRRRNPLLKLATKARDEVAAENDGKVSVDLIRERIWSDPMTVMSALDVAIAGKRLVDGAIRAALNGWPAYKITGGFEHVADEKVKIEELQAILAFREEQLANDQEATQAIRNRLADAVLREQLDRGIPVDAVMETAEESVGS
jgi:hypothetical protein